MGTRPEAIKLAPVVLALRGRPAFAVEVCATAQHRQMLDQALNIFGIVPDHDLNLMSRDQGLSELAARILQAFDGVLERSRPDVVMVQGDTTTTMVCALAAYHRRIRVAHVEAGLRTGDKFSPFPEELNRQITTRLADWHFAPTERSRAALLREGVSEARVFVTGNTVLDALLSKVREIRDRSNGAGVVPQLGTGERLILVTCHRRENFGEGVQNICAAIRHIAKAHEDVRIVFPVHLNPNVQAPVRAMLGDLANVHLIEPQDYLSFAWLLDRAHLVLTDSGGIQEEAPSLSTPVIVMRDETERMEAVEAGAALLVGSHAERIAAAAHRLLTDEVAWTRMARAANPFGDGHASARIADVLAGLPITEFGAIDAPSHNFATGTA